MEKEVNDAVANAAANPTIKPRVGFKDLTNKILASDQIKAGVYALPQQKTFARRVERAREKAMKCPAIPHEWKVIFNVIIIVVIPLYI